MAKKNYGAYTPALTKELKNSISNGRLICEEAAADEIYLCNGYYIFRLNREEYEAAARPAVLRDPGQWIMGKDQEKGNGLDLPKLFADTVKAVEALEPLSPADIHLHQSGKRAAVARCFYSLSGDFAALYNVHFLDCLKTSYYIKTGGTTQAAIVYSACCVPVGMILPIRPREEITRATRAYFKAEEPADERTHRIKKDLEQMRTTAEALERERNSLEKENAKLAAEVEQLKNQLAQMQEQAQEATQAAKSKPSTQEAAQAIASKFQAVEGVTVTIKGAQTASPVIWITGDTKPHAEEIKAAGGRWSAKKSAYYFHVA